MDYRLAHLLSRQSIVSCLREVSQRFQAQDPMPVVQFPVIDDVSRAFGLVATNAHRYMHTHLDNALREPDHHDNTIRRSLRNRELR